MKLLRIIVTAFVAIVLASSTVFAAWWLVTQKPETTSAAKSTSAAIVNNQVKEDELNTITLSEEAEKRIGLIVTPLTVNSVGRVRIYGGEVVVPIGRTIVVSAPISGVLKEAPNGEVTAGQSVKAGQTVFQLTPILTPDGRATLSASLADTDGLVNNAQTQVQLTTIALNRAKRVLRDGAGSQRQVDEAQAAYDLAAKSLDAAIARQAVLNKAVGQAEAETATPIPIEVPQDGIIRAVSALPGQTVPSGAALFEVIDISTIWVRVSLPVGDLETIDQSAPARIGKLSSPTNAQLPAAKPVSAPPTANPLSATVDAYYEMPNPNEKLIPGQRLGVYVPLADAESSLTVPWAAVVFDIHGGTWVYEQLSARRYVRRRVLVEYTAESDAVLASGPVEGAQIVTAGAQELFGAETGFVK